MGSTRTAIARSIRTVRRRPEPSGRGRDPEGPSGGGIRWVPVRSSWIAALRFVPTGREGGAASYYATGYVDMRTRGRGGRRARAYRYGPGVSQRTFNTWLVAASRGKYWWRYFTARWSPAQRLS